MNDIVGPKPIWEQDDQQYDPIFRAKFGRCWGSDITPPEFVIDPEKQYTCGGKKVIDLEVKLHNSCGKEVTFPVKGSVVLATKPKLKTKYCIWTLDGRSDVGKRTNGYWDTGDDLKEVL